MGHADLADYADDNINIEISQVKTRKKKEGN